MRHALIKNGVVENIILADIGFCGEHYPGHIAIPCTDEPGQPHVGDLYDGNVFSKPEPVVPVVDPVIKKQKDIEFGQKLMAEFSVLNDQRGLSDSQKLALIQVLSDFQGLLLVGDIRSVLNLLPLLNVDGILLTADIISLFQDKLQTYLDSN